MSVWNHTVCEPCYFLLRPNRMPSRLADAPSEKCCYCGEVTTDGIYYRDDPAIPQFCNAGKDHED